MKKINSITVFLLFCTILLAQESNKAKIVKPASENPIDIPYEKRELANG